MDVVLITGSNGIIAQKIILSILHLSPNTKIIATSLSPAIFKIHSNVTFELLDITQKSQLNYLVELYSPDIIINTAAISSADYCETNQDICYQTNVEAVKYLTEICELKNIYLCHFSTDFIFDGLKPVYYEDSTPNALSIYGNSKFESEIIVNNSSCNASIVRTSLVYGILQKQRKPNILNFVINSLRENKTIRITNDQYRTPTLAEDLAKACSQLVLSKITGTFNICGPEKICVYDVAISIAETFNLNKNLIVPCSTISLNENAKRPISTYLSIEKIKKEIAYSPMTLKAGLDYIKNSFEI